MSMQRFAAQCRSLLITCIGALYVDPVSLRLSVTFNPIQLDAFHGSFSNLGTLNRLVARYVVLLHNHWSVAYRMRYPA